VTVQTSPSGAGAGSGEKEVTRRSGVKTCFPVSAYRCGVLQLALRKLRRSGSVAILCFDVAQYFSPLIDGEGRTASPDLLLRVRVSVGRGHADVMSPGFGRELFVDTRPQKPPRPPG
jgi:hypothetical protein